MSKVGKNIEKARLALNLTQTDLGEMCGWDNSAQGRVSHYEKGRRQPGVDDIIDLSRALNTNIAELIGYDEFDEAVKIVLRDDKINDIAKLLEGWPDSAKNELLFKLNQISKSEKSLSLKKIKSTLKTV